VVQQSARYRSADHQARRSTGICRQVSWQNRLRDADVFDSSSAQFEQGRNAGREEERNRVIKTFHEEVSSSMIAALFLIETAKSELEEAGLPQAEAVSKASEILAETTEKLANVIGEADRNPE
jgi:signal transduction histidine kinase